MSKKNRVMRSVASIHRKQSSAFLSVNFLHLLLPDATLRLVLGGIIDKNALFHSSCHSYQRNFRRTLFGDSDDIVLFLSWLLILATDPLGCRGGVDASAVHAICQKFLQIA